MVDGHMHLEYGPLSEDYVLQFIQTGISKGLSRIQILDHTHRFKEFEPAYEGLKTVPQQKVWLENRSMKFKDSLSDYVALIRKVKEQHFPIEVSFGLEVCYVPEQEGFLRQLLSNYEFDFLVGAVHSVDGLLYDMSFSKEILWDVWDTDRIYRRYYELLLSCVRSGLFTQLAHPDTIKLFQYIPTYDLTPTYELLADELIHFHMLAEDNVGCTYRYQHPDLGLSDELLTVFLKKQVPLITASDAHHPEDVGTLIKEATEHIHQIAARI